jgi:hypothetical protein
MRIFAALGIFAAAAFMLYGWGWLARRVLRAPTASWPATAGSGMAALVFLGGVLNLVRLAVPWALACLGAVGIGFGALGIWKDRPKKPDLNGLAWFVVPAIALICVIATQVPPQAYNVRDDFQKYFSHPVRMLETGTVFGSRLNDIGLDTLGGQAFLDGFAAAFFPIQYINGVDAALALFLCMMLANEFKNILATLSVGAINPQYVNISTIYTGSFLIMAALMEDSAGAAVTGLLYAGMAALKGTFLLFAGVHLAAASFVRGFKWTLKVGLWGLVFVSPWIAVHAPHYIYAFSGGLGVADHGVRVEERFNLFSTTSLDYGSTPLDYTGLMIAVGLCGVMIARVRRRIEMTAAACFASIATYLFILYVSGPRDAGYAHALRYFTPFAIGIAPVAFGAAALEFSNKPQYRWIVAVVATVPLLGFVPSLRDRVEESIHFGSELAFSWLAPAAGYLDYNREVLFGDMRQRVAAAQSKVPPGEEVLAWINAPFYLNFKRNRVDDIEPGAGVIVPWAKLPDSHYLIFEYRSSKEVTYKEDMAEGPDLLRQVAATRLELTHRLNDIAQRSQKLYDDGGIAVFHN